MRVAGTIASSPENVLPAMSPLRVARSVSSAVIVSHTEVRSQLSGVVHQGNVPVAVLIRPLHSGNPVTIVRSFAAVRHVVASATDRRQAPARVVLDEANAEIGEFLGYRRSSAAPRAAQTPKWMCLYPRCLWNLGRHLSLPGPLVSPVDVIRIVNRIVVPCGPYRREGYFFRPAYVVRLPE